MAYEICAVGAPIELERESTGEFTEDDVDALHKKYMEALVELYDTHKQQFGVPAESTLEFTG